MKRNANVFFGLFLLLSAANVAHAQIPTPGKIPSVPKKAPAGVPGAGKVPGVADCGSVASSAAGAKITAFIKASGEVDKSTLELESSVKNACRDMAKALEIPSDGDTKALCKRVATELKASLKAGGKAKGAMKATYTPAVCKVDASFTAEAAAKCEGKAKADVKVTCSGSCSGSCKGKCAGTCESKNAKGECDGSCKGTCKGNCSGDCSGSADVNGSAECKASAQASGNMRAKCSEPKLDVQVDAKLVKDTKAMARAEKALKAGLPQLLEAQAKAKLAAKSVKLWATTAKKLGGAGAGLVKSLGMQATCVAGDLAAAAKTATQVNVRMSVSVEASASVSGAAGATAK